MFKKISKRQIGFSVAVIAICACAFCVYKWLFVAPFMYAGTLETSRVILTSHVSSDVKEIYAAEGSVL